jgi:hypothetical protein
VRRLLLGLDDEAVELAAPYFPLDLAEGTDLEGSKPLSRTGPGSD